jgi:hypothetical protein
MSKRSWFRVLLDASGKAVECKAVSAEGTDGGVFYILAASAAAAAREANNRHCAQLLAARRERYVAEGRCRCGRDRDDKALQSCAHCRSHVARSKERIEARKRGENVPKPDRRTVLLERKQTDAETLRLAVLQEVQDAWQRNRTVGAFSAWLNSEVAKLTGKKVA